MKLALTGGIAEGKSTVASFIREAGFDVFSADEAAREVFGLPHVQARLGSLLGVEPPVEPSQLRAALFERQGLRLDVNRLMHPLVLQKIEAASASVVEIPLLIEACLQGRFDRIWVVTCGAAEQLRRLIQRTGDEAQARAMVTAQLSTRVKCSFADRIVRTNADMDTVRSYVLEAIRRDLKPSVAHR